MKTIKDLLNKLYWKYLGELTIYGKYNGKTVIMCYRKSKIERLYVQDGGRIEFVHVIGAYVKPEEFKKIQSIYDRG